MRRRPFDDIPCPLCGKPAGFKWVFVILHLWITHGYKDWKCGCGKTFTSRKGLIRHLAHLKHPELHYALDGLALVGKKVSGA